MTSFEIRRVANGFMVFPNIVLGQVSETYVFETWEKCSEWIRQQVGVVNG